ncbi:MAG TPA: type IV pilus modification protein PilV [Burkholderiaceae bacterium]|nr:type IV pilus modification protein PilV [Burkholderiaceae bacterium]
MTTQRGFSLLEAMIASLVIAVGLLGIARMQGVSLANTQSASQRSVAIARAYDLADRMRANQAAVRAGDYLRAPQDFGCRAVHYDHRHAAPAACTPAQLAQDDLADWAAALAAELPGAAWTLCIDGTPDDGDPGAPACDGAGTSYTVKIWWNDKPGNATGDANTSPVSRTRVATRFQP